MKEYVKFIDDLPLIAKFILALPPFCFLVFGLYRLFKGHIIAAIVWLFLGWNIFAIVDMISILLYGNVKLFADKI